jgi:hypothetical protein
MMILLFYITGNDNAGPVGLPVVGEVALGDPNDGVPPIVG